MGVIVVTTQEDTGRFDAHRDCEDRDDRPLAGVDRYISEPMNAGSLRNRYPLFETVDYRF